jgi:hypothetical protein
MESTGATGPTEQVEQTGATGPIEQVGPTGATGPDLSMFPTAATGPVEPPSIATLDELMQSHAVVIAKEAADVATLNGSISTLSTNLNTSFSWR